MAQFSDLPFELKTDIWKLVLPHRGGIHWVEIEGQPHQQDTIQRTLEWNHELCGGQEPPRWNGYDITGEHNSQEFGDYWEDLDPSSLFFQHFVVVVPSFLGKQKGLPAEQLSAEECDEVAWTRRCRELSTYTQVTALLSTCQTSRLVALEFIKKKEAHWNSPWLLLRSGGPLFRPRHLDKWKQQYPRGQDIQIPESFESGDELVPTICGALDLVVYRFHTADGRPKDILKHAKYQMTTYTSGSEGVIPMFRRIGIEWNPHWGTEEGENDFCIGGCEAVLELATTRAALTTQLYWLVDGIPRPKWHEFPPEIPAAFSCMIKARKSTVLRDWEDEDMKEYLLQHHTLDQEFEANGRRYFVVFVMEGYARELKEDEEDLDSTLSWDGPFPGGEEIWPEALRAPVRFANRAARSELGGGYGMNCDSFCSYVLSWEPIL